MAGKRKLPPLEVFETTIADAYQLVKLAEGFQNRRSRKMRRELREKLGDALKFRQRDWDSLDCLESDYVFVIFKPNSELVRDDFTDPSPLLRQAVVAACAAFETYLTDKAMGMVGPLLKSSDSLTAGLRRWTMSLEDWMEIEEKYKRKRWGIRDRVLAPAIREMASTAPNRVGELLRALGVAGDIYKKLDKQRNVPEGATYEFLDRLTQRRNQIAHNADRTPRGRASLSLMKVKSDLVELESVVQAIERLLDQSR